MSPTNGTDSRASLAARGVTALGSGARQNLIKRLKPARFEIGLGLVQQKCRRAARRKIALHFGIPLSPIPLVEPSKQIVLLLLQ
jgi:hypothetical protein